MAKRMRRTKVDARLLPNLVVKLDEVAGSEGINRSAALELAVADYVRRHWRADMLLGEAVERVDADRAYPPTPSIGANGDGAGGVTHPPRRVMQNLEASSVTDTSGPAQNQPNPPSSPDESP
jgi:predicted transcriptional regulator